FDVARGENQIGSLHGFDDVEDREAASISPCRVEVDVDLTDTALLHRSCGDVGDLFNLWGNRIRGQVVEGPFVEIVAGDRHKGDWDIGDVELDDEGLPDAGRKAIENLGDTLHPLHLASVNVRAPVEPDLYCADALLGEGLDMLDVRRRTDSFLDGIDDTLFDVERWCAFIDHADERNRHLNLWKEIDRYPLHRGAAQDHHGQGQHQDADAVAKCEQSQPHDGSAECWVLSVGYEIISGKSKTVFRAVYIDAFNSALST